MHRVLLLTVITAVVVSAVAITGHRTLLENQFKKILPNGTVQRNLFQHKISSPSHSSQYNNLSSTGTEGCPTWMYRNNSSSECKCGVDYYRTIKCDQSIDRVYILDSHVMTFDEEHQEVIVGSSIYGAYTPNDNYDIYHLMPKNKSQLNEVVCGQYNRHGRLCGECKEGYSPLAYSYDMHCKQCSDTESKYNIPKFMAVAFVPLTVFYLLVVLLKFNASCPKLHGFLLYAQIIASPPAIRVLTTNSYNEGSGIKVLATVYGFWNLDFFRTVYPDMCLKVTTLQALALDYVIGFYPLFLMLITFILFRLHSKGCWVVILMWYPLDKVMSAFKKDWSTSERASMIDVFTTFLLLSYNKIMSVSFNLFIYTPIINPKGQFRGRYVYYDPSYEYFGKDHIPYGVLALVIFASFNILPMLLLFLYPMKWFQKCLNHFRLSHVALHTFVDSFAGSFKDGTEPGTRDCRYFAGLYLFVRVTFYTIFELTLTDLFYGISGIFITGVLFLHIICQPYKARYQYCNVVSIAMLTVIVLTLFSMVNVCIANSKMYQATTFSIALFCIIVFSPQLYLIAVGIKWAGFCNLKKSLTSRLPKIVRLQPSYQEIESHPHNDSEESLLISAT